MLEGSADGRRWVAAQPEVRDIEHPSSVVLRVEQWVYGPPLAITP